MEEIRHSAAHVLATAVLRLYPDTQLDIGPPTESGFYYDFDSEIPFTPEVLEAIEAEMKKVIKENQRFEKIEVSREEAIRMIKEMGQETYKLGRLDDNIFEPDALTLATEIYEHGSNGIHFIGAVREIKAPCNTSRTSIASRVSK